MQNEMERDEQGHMSDTEQNEGGGQERGEGDSGGNSSSSGSGGRGFAGMSEEQRRSIASKGGRSQGKDNNPGNFANDREKAVAAGAKGGQNSRGGGRHSAENSESADSGSQE